MHNIHAKKVLTIEEMAEKATRLKKEGKKVILCHGCFDLLHIGHIRYLQSASELGDELFVTITPDRFVGKGPHRPVFDESLRAEAVASLHHVKGVAINLWPTAEEALRQIKPDVYVKGSDFVSAEADPTGKLAKEAAVCAQLGIQLHFTKELVFSSSNLINRFFSSHTEETKNYLRLFRERFSIHDIVTLLDKMRTLSITLIGDAIIDEYNFCSTLGVSSKSPTLALKIQNSDKYAGGVMAIANHLSEFAKHIDLVSVVGDGNATDFIKSSLNANVSPHLFVRKDLPTTKKSRYIDGYSFSKLIEIYDIDDSELPAQLSKEMLRSLEKFSETNTMVVAADFGHGAISPMLREYLCASRDFLAINTQLNAGNGMFHTMSCYDRADFISITENELRLNYRDKVTHVGRLVTRAREEMKSTYVAATRGKRGTCVTLDNGAYAEVPAFTVQMVDSVGAGDAFFALSSMAAKLNAPPELIAFIGNLAGALAVQIVGNAKPVSREALVSFATALLK